MIPLAWELVLSALLFVIGLYGVLVRTNAIVVLMSVEIMFNAPILNLVAFSAQTGNPAGQVFALVAIALAAGEAAVTGARPMSGNAYKVQIARTAVKRALLQAVRGKA